MDSKTKRKRLQKVIETLKDIESSNYMDIILDDKTIKIIEVLLNIKPCSQKVKEVRRISGRGLKKKKSSQR